MHYYFISHIKKYITLRSLYIYSSETTEPIERCWRKSRQNQNLNRIHVVWDTFHIIIARLRLWVSFLSILITVDKKFAVYAHVNEDGHKELPNVCLLGVTKMVFHT